MGLRGTDPVFDAVATGPDGHDRMGPAGSGHYVKMVHNGVEYALMQAYGEGFELLANGRYDLDLEAVADTWNNGAVIRSWLLELCEEAFREEGTDLGDVADQSRVGRRVRGPYRKRSNRKFQCRSSTSRWPSGSARGLTTVASRAASPADSDRLRSSRVPRRE